MLLGQMARTKNRGQQTLSPSYTIPRWRFGEYIRLTKEDLKKGRDDSNSVKNKRNLFNKFYPNHQDEFESYTEYMDDGHTGIDTDREDFQRLLADVMSGKINCVIVKDLSRLSCNYSDAGSLIENLFVQLNIRFISLAESVDSFNNPDSASSIIYKLSAQIKTVSSGILVSKIERYSSKRDTKMDMSGLQGALIMVCPHPSYPPLEMSAFGVQTITNQYKNKNLAGFNDNICSLDHLSPVNLAMTLKSICDKYEEEMIYINKNEVYCGGILSSPLPALW